MLSVSSLKLDEAKILLHGKGEICCRRLGKLHSSEINMDILQGDLKPGTRWFIPPTRSISFRESKIVISTGHIPPSVNPR